jgi:hypothetical protein
MDREDIIRMAREAGMEPAYHPFNPWSASQEALERFARLVARHVRNARREADRLDRIEKRKRYAENKLARGE